MHTYIHVQEKAQQEAFGEEEGDEEEEAEQDLCVDDEGEEEEVAVESEYEGPDSSKHHCFETFVCLLISLVAES